MISKEVKRKGSQCVTVTLPELLQLSNKARLFTLSASRVKNVQSGFHLSRFLGRGMEFAECRRYQAGDDIRSMDWKVTARTGTPHTKLFAAEKERQVLLCVDMRSTMFFATKGVFKSVQASLLAGYIAWNAVLNGNRLGGMIFDDTSLFESRPALGKRGVLPFLQELAKKAHFPSKRSTQITTGSENLDHAIANLRRVANPGSLIFIISDFRHLSPLAHDQLMQLSKHNDLCLCFAYDPLEEALPSHGYYPVTDGNAEWQFSAYDKKNVEKYHKQFLERKTSVTSLCNQRHVHFLECSTESDCFELLNMHFN